jgi:hypothetical protein
MTVSGHIRAYLDDARTARDARHHREAALLYEQALQLAIRHQLPTSAFTSAIYAAYCWQAAGDPIRALNALADALHDIPATADPSDVFQARLVALWLISRGDGKLASLEKRLLQLERMANEDDRLPQRAPFYVRMSLLMERGRWPEALEAIELAWSRPRRGFDYEDYTLAFWAVDLNLRLRRRPEAGRWCELLEKEKMHSGPEGLPAFYISMISLALWDQRPRQARALSRHLEEAVIGIDGLFLQEWGKASLVRSLLLDVSLGDPCHAQHLARLLLLRRPTGQQSSGLRYHWQVLLLDYRIAALRYAVGMAPVDDRFYTRHQRVPRWLSRPRRIEGRQRLAKVRRTGKVALQLAQRQDERFQCEWRQQQVWERLERADEIERKVLS